MLHSLNIVKHHKLTQAQDTQMPMKSETVGEGHRINDDD